MCSGSPPPFLPAARGCGVLLLRNRVALIICAHRLGPRGHQFQCHRHPYRSAIVDAVGWRAGGGMVSPLP